MSQEHPNLIFLLVDDLRWDCVGAASDKRVLRRYGVEDLLETPTLDRLAEEGVYFSQAVSAATETPPSMAAIFTGCWAPVHGVRALYGGPLNPGVPTLWQHLSAAGYTSLACNPHEFTELNGSLAGCTRVLRNYWDCERDLTLIRNMARDLPRPFALYMHVWEVHRPFNVAAYPYRRHQAVVDFLEKFYEQSRMARPEKTFAAMDARELQNIWMGLWNTYLRTGRASAVERQFPLYVQGVSAFDQARLKSLLNYFQRSGLMDDTILVLCADHGETIDFRAPTAEPQFDHSCFPDDGTMRAPLFLHAPDRLPAGRDVPQQVSLADLTPTLLELCGVAPLDGPMNARSLCGLVHGHDTAHSTAYCEFAVSPDDAANEAFRERCKNEGAIPAIPWLVMQRAVRTPEYKYVELGEPLAPGDEDAPDAEFMDILCRKRAFRFENPAVLAQHAQDLARGRATRRDKIQLIERIGRLHNNQWLFDLKADPDERVNLLALDRAKWLPVAEPLARTAHEIWRQTIYPESQPRDLTQGKSEQEIKDMADRLRGLGYLD